MSSCPSSGRAGQPPKSSGRLRAPRPQPQPREACSAPAVRCAWRSLLQLSPELHSKLQEEMVAKQKSAKAEEAKARATLARQPFPPPTILTASRVESILLSRFPRVLRFFARAWIHSPSGVWSVSRARTLGEPRPRAHVRTRTGVLPHTVLSRCGADQAERRAGGGRRQEAEAARRCATPPVSPPVSPPALPCPALPCLTTHRLQ